MCSSDLGEILSLKQALRQPQIAHRGVLKKVNVPRIGDIEVFGLTALFDGTASPAPVAPPALGEHNAEIFGRLGLGEAELAALKQKAVI